MASRKSPGKRSSRRRARTAPDDHAETVAWQRPPWELRRLFGQVRLRAIDLRPSQHVSEQVLATGVIVKRAVTEPAWAWWEERQVRARHYLRRAVTGRFPEDPLGRDDANMPPVVRERMARFAILLAAIVLREEPSERTERCIRRRLGVLADSIGLPGATRRISETVARDQVRAADPGDSGPLETRTHHEAARHDRPQRWTSDDVEAARRQANEVARPWGWQGPTRREKFASRRAVPDALRRAFHSSYGANELQERDARDIAEGAELDHFEQASIDRVAIGRALTEHDILEYRRRRVSLPFNSHSRARIP